MSKGRISVAATVLVSVPLFLLLAACQDTEPKNLLPKLADPDSFKIQLYADFSEYGRLKAFQLTLSDGQNGFPKGLYVTSGPVGDERSDRLIRVEGPRLTSIVREGFRSNESLVFALGEYGEGILVTEPLNLRILRLLPNGEMTVFTELGTSPFGPAVLFYDAAAQLYVTDFSGGDVLRVHPDGTSDVFVTIPIPAIEDGFAGLKDGGTFGGGGAGRDFVVGVFTAGPEASGMGSIYTVSSDGDRIEQLAEGFDGLNLMTVGPGGAFGTDLYISAVGMAPNGDGGVYRLGPNMEIMPFVTGIDAVSVVFDSENILGGGMFISDMNDGGGAGRIWHVEPVR